LNVSDLNCPMRCPISRPLELLTCVGVPKLHRVECLMVDGIATLCSLSIEPPEPHKQCRYTFYDFELLELQWTARATDFTTKELLRVAETGGRAAMRFRRTTDSSHTSSHGTSITNVYVYANSQFLFLLALVPTASLRCHPCSKPSSS
jgi:hypothetical protein